jgi:hypothetical protein
VKITTIAALIIAALFFFTAPGQAEEHYIYKDPQGGLVISNQKPPAGSTILRKLDLPEFREAQMQQVQESSSARPTGKLESSPKQEQKK